MNETTGEYQSLEQVLISNSGGMVTSVGGVAATLFFGGGETVEGRMASLNVLRSHLEANADLLDEWHPPDARSRAKIGDTDIWQAYESAAREVSPEEGGGAIVQERPTHRRAPVRGYGEVTWARTPSRESHIVLAGPGATLDTIGLDAWVDRVLSWCSELQPTHGTAGIALLPTPGYDARSFAVDAWPLLARHPGLDWPDPLPFGVATRKLSDRHIRTSNWLTVLDDGFVERLGGLRAMGEALTEDCTLLEWDGGIVIRAGEAPQLGDVNQGIVPDAYHAVARLVAPLRFSDYSDRMPLFFPPPPASPGAESRKWLARFD